MQADPEAFGYTKAEAKGIKNVCPNASPGCISTCLVGSGHGGLGADVENFKINSITNARIRRQLLMEKDGEAFFTALIIEIAKHYRKWVNKGYRYCVRLNGTSDIDWEKIPVHVPKILADWLKKTYKVSIKAGTHKNIFTAFPKVRFYDYTKVPKRMDAFLKGQMPQDYYLTWSLAEKPSTNRQMVLRVLRSKKSAVAVPFDTPPTVRGKKWPLPKTLTIVAGGRKHRFKVFDADEDDLRFLDPRRGHGGQIAGLRFKLPTDRSKSRAIDRTDFRLKTKGQKDPVIGLGGNVINPGPGWDVIKKAAAKRRR